MRFLWIFLPKLKRMSRYIKHAKALGLLDDIDEMNINDLQEKISKLGIIFSDSALEEIGLRFIDTNTLSPSPILTLTKGVDYFSDEDTSSIDDDLNSDEDEKTSPKDSKTFWDLATIFRPKNFADGTPINRFDIVRDGDDGIPIFKICKINKDCMILTFKENGSHTRLSVKCDENLLNLFAKEYNLTSSYSFIKHIKRHHTLTENCRVCRICFIS